MKLNTKSATITSRVKNHKDVTLNEEGGIAFKTNAKTGLMLRVISSLISEDGFYKSGKDLDKELRNAIHSVLREDPAFVLKLAKYARTDLYLRTAPVVLVGEFGLYEQKTKTVIVPNLDYDSDYNDELEFIEKVVPSVSNSRRAVTDIIQRADEITELIAYVINQNKLRHSFKGKLPHVIKHGVADAFNKFDEYGFSKYNSDGEVKLRDAMFLTHPKPKDKRQEKIFKKIAEKTLEPADTWEVALSTKGASKKTWDDIIPKMKFMALLRNMRNFLIHGVDMDPVIAKLTDPEEVKKSKQFPYRFFSAYREIENMDYSDALQDALHDALDISIENAPTFKGITYVASDNSGSMHVQVSSKSKIERIEIAALFSAMVKKKSENAIISVFGRDFAIVPCSGRSSTLDIMKKIMHTNVGHSTNAYLAIKHLVENKIHVDRIVIFSDMQCYDSGGYGGDNIYNELLKYKRTVNPKVYTYSFDLASYGTTQIPSDESRVCLAGGFSDKVLNFIPKFEQDKTDMLSEIENIKI